MNVLEWNSKPFPDNFRSKLNESEVLKLAYNFNLSLPDSDLYVMETFSIRGKELHNKINEIHLSSMLIVLLNGINKEFDLEEKVFFQKQSVINHLFSLLIGNDRTSSSNAVNSIIKELEMHNYIKTLTDKCSNDNFTIQIPPKCIESYIVSNDVKKEDLAISFLLTLSFIKVNILQNETTFEKLNSSKWQLKKEATVE
ncbi:conserved hypothetical protein [Pediculus humanus corporis]|uniref:Uncharacterized protein n=1 Tax=Pediculus humanus subsp. corporis TaxID=121224 RepID=E0VAN4_PEDHC|nr:uncharacterized protein Phum_PHUM041630 [Pediculus humanus corporis]EEB10440.1 conserved hypothetical protein [Pediculus humanus corporis]